MTLSSFRTIPMTVTEGRQLERTVVTSPVRGLTIKMTTLSYLQSVTITTNWNTFYIVLVVITVHILNSIKDPIYWKNQTKNPTTTGVYGIYIGFYLSKSHNRVHPVILIKSGRTIIVRRIKPLNFLTRFVFSGRNFYRL